MGILAECPNPLCRRKQSNRNRVCKCGADLQKLKRSRKVKYWISYRLPGGKQKRESVAAFEGLNGYSIEDARDAWSKRSVQKREKRLLDMVKEYNTTFQELTDWYLGLSEVQKLASYKRVGIALNNFNKVFGNRIIGSVVKSEIENFQAMREKDISPATIDIEISTIKTMITAAFDNDKLDGHALKAFRKIKRKLKRGANARERTINFEEYIKLIEKTASHFKPVLIIAFNTGMRSGELQKLKWSYIDKEKSFIRLPPEVTKERKAKDIPINHNVKDALDSLPRALMHDFVFTYKGRPLSHINGFVSPFKTACDRAGLPYGRNTKDGITFHDTRRTVKTNMVAAGVDPVYRDLILGHSLQGMDMHYLAPSEDTLKEAMSKYTAWIDEKLAETSQLLTKVLTKTG